MVDPPITHAFKLTSTNQQVLDCSATNALFIIDADAFTDEVWINQNSNFVKLNVPD